MKKLIYFLIGLSFPISASAQLQNLDFELCDTTVVPHLEGENCRHLEGWISTQGSAVSDGWGFTPNTGGVPDAQNGEMALRLSVFYNYAKKMAYQRAPYTLFPYSLSGYYTYTDNVVWTSDGEEPDIAEITVILSKWNTLLWQRDTIGFGQLQLNNASSYTHFSCPINYVSTAVPDSIFVLLDCSRVNREAGLIGGIDLFNSEGSFFTVDNFSLEVNALDLEEAHKIQKWKIFPNPGNGIIHISDFKGDAVMFDINGKLIGAQSYPDFEIDASLLPQGVYLLRLTEKSGQISYTKYVKK